MISRMNVFALLGAALLAGLSINYPIPLQYQGNATFMLHVVDRLGIDAACGRSTEPGQYIIGCANASGVYGPNPCDYPEAKTDVHSYAHFMCHEKAHINGWHHD